MCVKSFLVILSNINKRPNEKKNFAELRTKREYPYFFQHKTNHRSIVNQDGFEVNFNSASEKFNQPISILFDLDNNVHILHENRPPRPIFSMRSSSKSVSSLFNSFVICYIAEEVHLTFLLNFECYSQRYRGVAVASLRGDFATLGVSFTEGEGSLPKVVLTSPSGRGGFGFPL